MSTFHWSDRMSVLRTALVLLPAAFYFSIVADLPHVLALTLLALVAGAFCKQAWPVTDRTVVYSLVAALAMTTLGNYIAPLKLNRFGFMAFVLRPSVLVPFLLYATALCTGFRRRDFNVGIAATAALITFGIGGDVRINHLATERWPDLEFTPLRFAWFYGSLSFFSILAVIFGARYLECAPWKRRSTWLVIPALLLMLGGVYGEFVYYRTHINELRRMENKLLRLSGHQYAGRGHSLHRMQLSDSPKLFMPFPRKLIDLENEVILRVVGKSAPGYLRCRAFTVYRIGYWESNSDDHKDALDGITLGEGLEASQLYKISQLEPGSKQWLALPSGRLSGNEICYQGGAKSIEIMADQVSITPDGRIDVDNIVNEAGYTIHADRLEASEFGYPQPEAPGSEYTVVPIYLGMILSDIADSLNLWMLSSDQERFEQAEQYFRNNFQYSLDWPGERNGRDPLLVFLLEARRGHCQLFASALALLLRECGIPTRYVSGVVCRERHPSGSYYIARVRNIHAWVEAYDRDRKCWVVLDGTPVEVTEPPVVPDDWRWQARSTFDRLQMLWQQLLCDLRRGKIGAAIIDFALEIGRMLLSVILHPIGGPLVFLLVSWGGYRWWKRCSQKTALLTSEQRRAHREFLALCRKLRRKRIIPRQAVTPTALEVTAILEAHPKLPEPNRQELLTWLEEYRRRRFRVSPPPLD